MSRGLMIVSAAWMAACGLALSFAPQELLGMAGAAHGRTAMLVLQLLGAVYLGGAMTNWMAKGSLVGGVFGRPLAIGNLAHFGMGAFALGRLAWAGATALWPVAVLYAALAACFYRVAFGQPKEASCT